VTWRCTSPATGSPSFPRENGEAVSSQSVSQSASHSMLSVVAPSHVFQFILRPILTYSMVLLLLSVVGSATPVSRARTPRRCRASSASSGAGPTSR
jgi:CBS-domain-containing membrane protein